MNKISNKNLRMEDIIDKIIIHKEMESYPGREKLNDVIHIIEEFLKTHDVKIYGGSAIHQFTPIYEKDKIPDFDGFTTKPKKYAVKLANALFKNGHNEIVVKPSNIWTGVYKIFVYDRPLVDFSYLPEKIYNIIPYKKFNGIQYITPEFIIIDLFKTLVFPKENVYRWKKDTDRLNLMLKNFPIKPVKEIEKKFLQKNTFDTSFIKKLQEKTNLLLTGISSYILLTKGNKTDYYEFITPDYKKDKQEIDKIMKEKYNTFDIKYHYPVGKILPRKYVYTKDGKIILIIYSLYDYSLKCINYYLVDNIKTTNYHFNMYLLLTMKFIGDIVGSNYLKLISNYYSYKLYELNKKQQLPVFQLECVGEIIDKIRESKIKLKEKKISKTWTFEYTPTDKKILDPENVSSGASPELDGSIYNIEKVNGK